MDVKIDFKKKEIKFKGDMSLSEFDHMKMKFASRNGAPQMSKPNWWYKQSPFGLYFLKQLVRDFRIVDEFDKEEWRLFYPIFRHYFPTIKEYAGIKNNIAFWNGRTDSVLEDAYYIKWVLLHRHGLLNYGELQQMPFKEAMVLYYYAMLNNIFERADNYSKTIADSMRKQMPESKEEIYR